MKNLLLSFLLITTTLIAQDRKQLKGSISSALGEPIEGIAIFNNSTLDGTVSNVNGDFFIDVRAGDELSFDALQYDPFVLIVTQSTVDKGTIDLTFSEGVNLLEEVVVMDQTIRVAVKRTEMPETGIEEVSERNIRVAAVDRIENTFSDRIRQPEEIPVQQVAQNQSQLRYNSFNFLGLLSSIAIGTALQNLDLSFGTPAEQREEFNATLLKNKYSTEYLTEFLDISQENLYEFIVFANEKGLTKNMLEQENEFQLLQFLDKQAEIFKTRLETNDKSNSQSPEKQ